MRGTAGKWGAGAALAGLLVGCGGFEKSVYDIELNAEELSDVPFRCESGTEGHEGAWDLPVQQRWTITAGEYGDTLMQVPGLYRTRFHGDTGVSDDVPYELDGTRSSEGPFQFLAIDSADGEEGSFLFTHRFFIDGDSLEADRIQGFLETRTTSSDILTGEGSCSARVGFTGRRVKQ
ncbi:hypothetical protein LZ198_19090 [Myxococcus sp. K15C18031901]|uniref:hypothetical protein n=1 Tax=Myxococcus dinghuensis TaxID=2906761 RepID=UPI0020A7EC57|nr:hypothetical protein [Myxococcus dinghuensis]MCP3100983.1 hypothetical protein [Myxococcus dinghuensis]